MPSKDQLLAQIAALPNTVVIGPRPGSCAIRICHQISPSHLSSQSIWLDRPLTLQYLQEYLKNRQGA